MNAREAAYLSLTSFERIPIDEAIIELGSSLSKEDFSLAREIALGTARRLLSLEFIAKKIQRKLGLKKKERRLLFSALYQHFFMKKIPLYAIVNETTEIAKKYFGKGKANFFNAFLRKLEKAEVKLPHKKNAFDLSFAYSYPPYFIKQLIEEYGMRKAIELLKIQNDIFDPMCRVRREKKIAGLEKMGDQIYQIRKKILPKLIKDPDVYIQNGTPVLLMKALQRGLKVKPKKVLDLCASPGGKLLFAHDLFPKSKLFANDVSLLKLKRLKENLEKYQIDAELSQQRAESFESEELFDLIILDVPCSNSGVLHKRAEARWRLQPEYLDTLSDLQADILERAVNFLAPEGQIWYMTCSILQSENEDTLEFAKAYGLEKVKEKKILPDKRGFDGGYALSLKKI